MHRASKFLLFLVALVAVLALAVGPASATEPIEGVTANHAHCPSLAAGGCPAHAEGEATLFFQIFGIESVEARCHVEGEGIADENGNGQMTSYVLSNGAHGESNCPSVGVPCAGSLPWTGTAEETAPGVVTAHSDICIDPAEAGTCSGEYRVSGTETTNPDGTESGHGSATDIRIGASSFCEVTVAGESENDAQHPPGHINHL